MESNALVVSKVAEVHDWIDARVSEENPDPLCSQCGKCCDFESYDHRLYVTTPEIIYLTAHLGEENIKPMPTGRCPYNIENKCTIHKLRFAGCRIFNCKADTDFQSQLSESTIKTFKEICNNTNTGYKYTDLKTALNRLQKR